jgi:hypothetical protein
MRRLLWIHQVIHVTVRGATHDNSVEVQSRAYYRHVLRTVNHMKASSHACCSWIERGAIVMGGEAVWNVSIFRHLLQRYL